MFPKNVVPVYPTAARERRWLERFALASELGFVQLPVQTCAAFDDLPAIHHQDLIRR